MPDLRLMRMRLELYTAAQTLKGEDADEFWKLIGEIHSIRPLDEEVEPYITLTPVLPAAPKDVPRAEA